jgi:hypothetical protein
VFRWAFRLFLKHFRLITNARERKTETHRVSCGDRRSACIGPPCRRCEQTFLLSSSSVPISTPGSKKSKLFRKTVVKVRGTGESLVESFAGTWRHLSCFDPSVVPLLQTLVVPCTRRDPAYQRLLKGILLHPTPQSDSSQLISVLTHGHGVKKPCQTKSKTHTKPSLMPVSESVCSLDVSFHRLDLVSSPGLHE